MFTTDINTAAEREADAIARMADYTDEPIPQTRLQLALDHARAAAELNLPSPPVLRYCRVQSYRAFDRLARASWHYMIWGPPASKRIPSTNDRDRRADKFLRRAKLLLEMRAMPGNQIIDLATAATLSAIGLRTLHRACEESRLTATKSYAQVGRRPSAGGKGQWITTIGSIRDYLHAKLNGPMKRKPARTLTTAA